MHFVICLVLLVIILVYADKDKAKKQNRIGQYHKYNNGRTAPADAFESADRLYYGLLDKFMYRFVEELKNVADHEHREDCVFPEDKLNSISKSAAVRILYEFDGWWAKEHDVNIDVFSFTCGEQLYAMDLADKWFTESVGRQYDMRFCDDNDIERHKKIASMYDVSLLRPGWYYEHRIGRYEPGIDTSYYEPHQYKTYMTFNTPLVPSKDMTTAEPFKNLTDHRPLESSRFSDAITNHYNGGIFPWFRYNIFRDIVQYADYHTFFDFRQRGVAHPFGIWKEEFGKVHWVQYQAPSDHLDCLIHYGCPAEYVKEVRAARDKDLKLAEEYRESQQKK